MNETKDDGTGKSALALMLPLMIDGLAIGGLMNMFGFGDREPDKKDIAKGVLNLVFDAYDKEIDKLEEKNMKLESDKDKLEEQIKELKAKLEPKETPSKKSDLSSSTPAKQG